MLGFFSAQQYFVLLLLLLLLLLLFRMNIIIVVTNDITTMTCFDLYRSFYVIHTLHFLTFNILTNKIHYVKCNKTSQKHASYKVPTPTCFDTKVPSYSTCCTYGSLLSLNSLRMTPWCRNI